MRNYFITIVMVICACVCIHEASLTNADYYKWMALVCGGIAVVYGGTELRKSI